MIRLLALMLILSALAACDQQPDPQNLANNEPTSPARESPGAAPAELSGAELFVIACQGCHNLSENAPHRVGPNLYGIAGQPAASREGFSYSPALTQSGLGWSTANLTAWVVATESLVPGTWMLYHNILQPDEVNRLIGYIEQTGLPAQP